LAEWHSRWLEDRPVRPDFSTFLRSLRSRVDIFPCRLGLSTISTST
jgi:hypothetical protein